MSEGWIKIHRSLMDHWLYKGKFSRAQAWIDLLMLANHKPTKVLIKGQLYDLKPGQLAWSQESLSVRWNWTRSAVRRFFLLLKTDHQIDHQGDRNTSITTILNWSEYQTNGQQTIQQTANRRPTADQQTATDKNDKNVKNEKNVKKEDKSARPTEEECHIYFKELKGTDTDASEYFDFYSAKGWRVGRDPMKDWRAAARNWMRRKSEFSRGQTDDWKEKFLSGKD